MDDCVAKQASEKHEMNIIFLLLVFKTGQGGLEMPPILGFARNIVDE